MEAQDLVKEIADETDWKGIFSGSAVRRRKALKQLAYKMPFRPALMWNYLMFARGAFLDGIPGINYCFMRATYEYMIDLKVKELRRREKNLPI